MATGISARLSQRDLRRFAFTIAIPMILLAVLSAWRGHTFPPALLGGAAVALLGLGLASPAILRPVHRFWMGMAEALGWFNTRLLLSLVYFLMMTPIGIVMRMVGRDPLNRRLNDRPSYWLKTTHRANPRGSMELRF